MSEVKRYELKDIGPTYHKRTEMVLSVYGCWVYYDDYAELKAQRDALAAENAALKDIDAWCKTAAFQNMYREFKTAEAIGCPDVDCMHDAMMTAIMHAPETPATDAYHNSVRAEGVEMFARFWGINCGHEKTFIGSEARAFAAQLRSGEPS